MLVHSNLQKKIKLFSPKNFKEETTTVWSFKHRGNWATHSGEYRGNWSPYIPRNIILKYSNPGDLVLDYFCGGGTTAIECKLLGRRCVGIDINEKAIELAKKNLQFQYNPSEFQLFVDNNLPSEIYEPQLFVGDARDLSFLNDESVDLICSHPPYANAIHYTDNKKGDLSFLDIEEFLKEMAKVAKESFRVLKSSKHCAILIGDLRRKKSIIPLGFKLIDVFLKVGFKLKELIIKIQHNCKTTGFWYENSIKYNFLLLAHEYLLVFEKPILKTSYTKEVSGNYSLIEPTIMSQIETKKLSRLETTTVWIFKGKSLEEQINSNVIKRYAGDENYLVVEFKFSSKRNLVCKKNNKLILVKSSLSNNGKNLTIADIKTFISKLRDITKELIGNNTQYFVFQLQDIRIGGYIVPVAKMVVDFFSLDSGLLLKEIIIVVKDEENFEIRNEIGKNYLKITHQYLLVYEVKNENNN
ncbi:MAG: DNA methyltransferase [Endomicrobia bacterium]|nr:DNA methyltransferase [Endomicrobiia bacterium]